MHLEGLLDFKSQVKDFSHLVAFNSRILGDLGPVLEPLHLGRRHAVDLAFEDRLKKEGREWRSNYYY